MVGVVVGGQYGSEAKGKAVVHYARQQSAETGQQVVGIRGGGSNAGHTVYFGDQKYVVRHIPSCVAIPDAILIICAGAMVDPNILNREVRELESMGVKVRNRLFIDTEAVAIGELDPVNERIAGLGASIGSTQTGNGITSANRCLRKAVKIVDDERMGDGYMYTDTFDLIHTKIKSQAIVMVEGTQGFGLSMFHSQHYPFCTSRDTTASACLSEAGISPMDAQEVVMVVRTYPIRVGGNSGPMHMEINWSVVRERCGAPDDLTEMTSVTKKVRRVGEFDWGLFARACQTNRPSQIMVHGIDYIDWKNRGVRELGRLTDGSIAFIGKLSDESGGVPITAAFTGPHQDDVVDMGEIYG